MEEGGQVPKDFFGSLSGTAVKLQNVDTNDQSIEIDSDSDSDQSLVNQSYPKATFEDLPRRDNKQLEEDIASLAA